MDWQRRPALVTMAGGLIDSHLVETLLDRGAKVRAFVRYNSRGDIGLLSLLLEDKREALEIVAGDLRDPYTVNEACQGVTHVFLGLHSLDAPSSVDEFKFRMCYTAKPVRQ